MFQDSHVELTTWFRAIWHICVHKKEISAMGLQCTLGVGSDRTAWLMLHNDFRDIFKYEKITTLIKLFVFLCKLRSGNRQIILF